MYRVCLVLSDPADMAVFKETLLSADGIECGKILNTGDHLVPLIAHDRTDILIIDTKIPGPDVFEMINSLKSQKNLEVILLAPAADFSLAYRAMKAHVCELLVRPFTTEQVSDAILLASRQLKTASYTPAAPNAYSRNLFAEQLDTICDGMKTISEINHAFQTTFQDGLFRVVSFAIDFNGDRHDSEIIRDVWHTIQRFIYEKNWFNAYDVIYTIVYNEIRICLNYPAASDSEIRRMLPNLFLFLQNTYRSSPDLKIFLGIGQAYDNVHMLPVSSEESKKGIWSRMSPSLSGNRVVFYTDEPLSSRYRSKMLELDKHITNAMDTLNKDAFSKYVNAFFSLPENILCSAFSRELLLNQIRYFRNKFMKLINQIDNSSLFYHRTKMALLTSQTFAEYRKRYIHMFLDMFDRLSAYSTASEQRKYVTQAQNILQNNYMNSITLEEVADKLEISSNYLSRLFHETTGTTFSSYLSSLRLISARSLLIETNCSIKEISRSVGYPDQRYFARIFTKETGVTPTEYRRLHSRSTAPS